MTSFRRQFLHIPPDFMIVLISSLAAANAIVQAPYIKITTKNSLSMMEQKVGKKT